MLKKTINICFLLFFLSTAAFLNGCSGESSSDLSTDTTFLESGVKFIYLERGDGRQIDSMSHVTVDVNLIIAGDTIWSTYEEGEQPFEFDAKRTSLIKGFDEVVMYGKQGDRILAIIPPDQGYGERGSGEDIPPNATLQFDLSMVEVGAPKIFLSDILYPIYLDKGVEEMISEFQGMNLDTATHNLEITEWYDLGNRIMQANQHADAVALWDYKLTETPTLQGYYIKAVALENLSEREKAINTLIEGMKVASDTAGYGFVKRYLESLQSN